MSTRTTISIPAQHTLTVTASAISSGHIAQLVSGSSPTNFATVAASTSVEVTATSAAREYEIVSDTGTLTHTLTEVVGGGISAIIQDTTPQLGGDLDLNSKKLDFATIKDIDDCIDDDTMATATDTNIATAESIKAYIDANPGGYITELSTDLTPQLGGDLDANGHTIDGRVVATDGTKLDGIETGATADQTGAEIKIAYESEADTNAFTDAEKTKLSGIEDAATADQTGAEIKLAYEGEANTNAFTDAEKTKLGGVEALADVTDETNVVSSLDGATLTAATVATDDKVVVQDTSDSNNIKTVTAQSIADLGGGLSNPMTTAGDVIKGGTAGVAERLAVGSNDEVLTVVSGAPAWATASSGGGSGQAKNLFVGGDFSINPWQRGTSIVSPTGHYTADGMRYTRSGISAVTVTKDTDTPTVVEAGILATHSLKIACTTADGVVDAADYAEIVQRMEGYLASRIAQRTFAVSFWVKAVKTGIYSFYCSNATGYNFVSEYTINTTNTWEKKTIVVSASPAAGTWDYTNGIGIIFGWSLVGGSTYTTTTLDTWAVLGAGLYSTNQVNGLDSTSNEFRLALIQVEAGSSATDFEIRTVGEELALCQRYFYKSYNQGVDPGAVSSVGKRHAIATTAISLFAMDVTPAIAMRATPTVVWYSNDSGDSGKLYNSTDAADVTISSTSFSGESSAGIPVVSAAQDAGDIMSGHVTLSAEL